MFRGLLLVGAILLLFASVLAGFATQGTPIDRVEEDWSVVVATPSPTETGPQLTTTMSPLGDNSKNFAAFNLNYRDTTPVSPGGLDVRVWNGGTLQTSSIAHTEVLSTNNETITWTQRMHVEGGNISFSIRSGQSTTWGNFGATDANPSELHVYYPSPVSDLSAYSPAYSCSRSKVGWQSQLVSQMRIVQVRYYSNGTLITTDSTVRDCLAAASQ